MLELDEITRNISEYKNRIDDLSKTLKVDELNSELAGLENKMNDPAFWNDKDESSKTSARVSQIKKTLVDYNEVNQELNDLNDLIEIYKEESIEEYESEIKNSVKSISKQLDALEISVLLSDKYDNSNAIVTIHPGAGGTEAQDWAQMLYRMYARWAQDHEFKCEEIDYLDGDEAGIKSVTFVISGPFAYGYLKSENGVHRLVRISPFDAGGRRHTSFASVEVLPEIDDNTDVEIKPEDIKMDVFRASGAGGQHINKTSSAVRLTHIPTGIVVSCQTQRSQFQNKDYAMKMLKSKLIAIKEKENLATIDDLKGVQMDIAWGSQIRSYVFCPYTMVKDHRTNYEVGNVEAVMDGDIDEFIFAYLKYLKTKE